MKLLGCWILTVLSALALVAEAGDTRKSSESVGGLVSEILGELISVERIKVQVADSPSECRSFKMTSDQVVLFFKKARVISDFKKRDE